MNILFLNPPDEHKLCESPNEEGEGVLESDDFGYFPPLGILYVLSYLEARMDDVTIHFHDCVAEKISHAEIPSLIEKIKPDVVGITSFTISLVDIVKLAKTIRGVKPEAHLCLGGHHPIAFPVQAAQLKEFDSVIVGEGEKAFYELVKCIKEGKPYEEIEGLYTNESIKKWIGKDFKDKRFLTHVNIPAAYMDELDKIPFPNRKHLKADYHSVVGYSKKMATIITTRGCPYLCTFCDVPYKKYRTRSMDNLFAEIELCLEQGFEEFHFYDDLFNITPRKVIEFCDEVEKRNLNFKWDFRGRVNAVNEESIRRAKKAGCRQISFGVETGTDEGLKILKKGTNTKKVKEAFDLCRKYKIRTIADYIIGFPFEKTEDDIKENIDFLLRLNPDFAQIAILMVLPNTPLYFEALNKGLVKNNEWEEFCLNPTESFKITHWEEHFSLEELRKFQDQAYRRFYFRPKNFINQIKNIDSFYDFKTKVFGLFKLIQGLS